MPAWATVRPAETPGTRYLRACRAGISAAGSARERVNRQAYYRRDVVQATRPFVGRQQELALLRAAFDRAAAGQGGVVAVLGEPGIGKTTLCERAADYANHRGGRVLIGHCYEQSLLSLPYLPFIEALNGYVLACDPQQLRSELGPGAGYVARVMPLLAQRLDIELTEPRGDAEEERYRVLDALTEFLRRAAGPQCTVVVLEDLHAADLGTLDLLLHLARRTAESRLLVIGTYRDTEVDRSHRLSSTLAELRRMGHFGRVVLGGLGAGDVRQLLTDLGLVLPHALLADAVLRHTDGNPLFVHELARLLASDAGAADYSAALSTIPEGLRAVIGQRLARLSPPTLQLLSVAAVVGREFDVSVLQSIAGLGEDGLASAIQEALRAGRLHEHARPGSLRYRFAHALFCQTLYEEVVGPRRVRLHQQVARMLENRYAAHLDVHAAELAEHFARSTDPDDLAKAIVYHERAAHAAVGVAAFGEAADAYRQALQLLGAVEPHADLGAL